MEFSEEYDGSLKDEQLEDNPKAKEFLEEEFVEDDDTISGNDEIENISHNDDYEEDDDDYEEDDDDYEEDDDDYEEDDDDYEEDDDDYEEDDDDYEEDDDDTASDTEVNGKGSQKETPQHASRRVKSFEDFFSLN